MEEFLSTLPDPMRPDESILIIAGIFLVLIFILNRMIFKPLVAVLDEREKRVKEGAEAQERALQTVEESEAKYRTAVIQARRDAQSKRQEMHKKIEAIRDEKLQTSREHASSLADESKAELDKQVTAARASMENETQAIAEQIVTKVLSRASA